ncbi:3-hydroxyacyl-CoA dehydrogenase NAD-binding domain-containing protein [Streptomyces sp. NPDC054919]
MPVSRIGVVGCGLTGSGIVEVCARSGLDVNVAERGEEALAAGRSRVVTSLDRGLRSGKLSESERQGGSTGSRSRLALRTLPEAARPDIAPAALGHGGAVLGADVSVSVSWMPAQPMGALPLLDESGSIGRWPGRGSSCRLPRPIAMIM